MSLRISIASCLLASVTACSSAPPGAGPNDGGTDSAAPPTVGNHDSGIGGSGGTDSGTIPTGPTADAGGSGGSKDASHDSASPGTDSGSVGVDSGTPPPQDGGANGVSKCGSPLDTVAPTATSIESDGPFAVTSYTTGLPTSTAYKSLTAFYPTKGTGPFVVVMISPGLTEILQYLQPWAQRFASYGYVAVFVEANDTNNDSEATRADGLWAAIASIKGENTRTGSPLLGKLSNCLVTSGHSLGGGASLSIANAHPSDVTAALGFNPYDPTTTFSSIVAPTLVLTGQNDTTAAPAQHGRRQYDSMPSSISKEYVEISGGNHQAALSPGTIPGPYALAWIKFTVDGDTRYRSFLSKAASGLSDFATTLP